MMEKADYQHLLKFLHKMLAGVEKSFYFCKGKNLRTSLGVLGTLAFLAAKIPGKRGGYLYSEMLYA